MSALSMTRPTPTDDDFDDMHHALGRPDGPHVEPSRNRFVCAAVGPEAARFDVLGLWSKVGKINAGQDAIYQVTTEGRTQMLAWLANKQRAAGLRPWAVDGAGLTRRIVPAKSRSAAKYAVWLEVCDFFEGGYGQFLLSGVKARLA